jgi:hypothetical protein
VHAARPELILGFNQFLSYRITGHFESCTLVTWSPVSEIWLSHVVMDDLSFDGLGILGRTLISICINDCYYTWPKFAGRWACTWAEMERWDFEMCDIRAIRCGYGRISDDGAYEPVNAYELPLDVLEKDREALFRLRRHSNQPRDT